MLLIPGIERALVRVGDLVVGRNGALRRGRHAAGHALSRADAREQGHDAHALLEARRAGREHERRPRLAVAHEPHGAPDVDRLCDDVTARRHQHDAAGRRGPRLVHRRLQADAVIGVVVAAHAEGLRCDVDRLGIVGPRGEDGLGRRRTWHREERGGNQESDHVERHRLPEMLWQEPGYRRRMASPASPAVQVTSSSSEPQIHQRLEVRHGAGRIGLEGPAYGVPDGATCCPAEGCPKSIYKFRTGFQATKTLARPAPASVASRRSPRRCPAGRGTARGDRAKTLRTGPLIRADTFGWSIFGSSAAEARVEPAWRCAPRSSQDGQHPMLLEQECRQTLHMHVVLPGRQAEARDRAVPDRIVRPQHLVPRAVAAPLLRAPAVPT